MQVDDTAHVGSGCVDGRVQTEARGVHWEAAAALFHHLSQDVHLDLGQSRGQTYGHRAGGGPSVPSPEAGLAHAYPRHLLIHHTVSIGCADLGEEETGPCYLRVRRLTRDTAIIIQHEKCSRRVYCA